jgi:hypothetical protein
MTLYQDSRPVITMTDNSVNRKGSRQIATLKYFIFFFESFCARESYRAGLNNV